jgi:hypothetical protein
MHVLVKFKDAFNKCSLCVGVQLSWLRNATLLLSTVSPTQLMPINLVTRPSLRAELQPNERIDNDSIVIEADTAELMQTTTTSTTGIQCL